MQVLCVNLSRKQWKKKKRQELLQQNKHDAVNKKIPKSKATKLRKENKFLTYFEPMFLSSSPREPQKKLGLEKGNIGSKWVEFLADVVLGLVV